MDARPPYLPEHLAVHLQRVERLLTLQLEAGGLGASAIPGVAGDDPQLAFLSQQLAEIEEDAARAGCRLPIPFLISRFGLSAFEQSALLLVVAAELSESCARLLGLLRGGSRHGYVDPQICLALFAPSRADHYLGSSSFEPDSRLFRAGLLHAAPISGTAPYRIAQCLSLRSHVRATLRGERKISDELMPLAERRVPQLRAEQIAGLDGMVRDLGEIIGGFYKVPLERDPLAVDLGFPRSAGVALCGVPGSGRGLALRTAAAQQQRALLEINSDVLAAYEDWHARLVLACQEAELYGELLHLRRVDQLMARVPAAAALCAELLRRRTVLMFLSHEDPSLPDSIEREILLRLKTPLQLRRSERVQVWRSNIPAYCQYTEISAAPEDPPDLEAVVDDSPLKGGEIRRAVRLAELRANSRRSVDEPARLRQSDLLAAARAQRRFSVGSLTASDSTRRPAFGLSSLVLSEDCRRIVTDILRAVGNRQRVLREWGFETLMSRGSGIICLFDGPPGTGKTLTAEVLADELGLELHRTNVAQVVDKYIGETEKHLTRLFTQVVPERTLLLFDEADSLFGARVQVSTANDRFANSTINTLLQLIEQYQGVVVLATNLKDRIDTAFKRRIMFHANFEMPDEPMRLSLWAAHLPESVPLDGSVDLSALARDFELSGGNIKNVVLRAALVAIDQGVLTQQILREQACYEVEASGHLVSRHAYAPSLTSEEAEEPLYDGYPGSA